ncbi:hypothetical protein [Flavobacterium sp. CSZ]|uniref:hypothetical protein n=1 Tax=Flavobacterium sp. CSZ TaxID=2783791 RepID=UPI00188C25B0|nr:hypothetical protein [Flavobacterium sp. CSZ]MBF4485719.1 hypothetical protein [Flavobacterium sp. CSZ]
MMTNNSNSKYIFFLLISFLFLFSCRGQSNPECLTALNEKISPHVNEKNKIGEVINLKDDLNCFDWDSLIIIMPLYLDGRAEKELGITFPKDADYTLEPKSSAIFLFVKDKKVVHSMLQKAEVNKEVFHSYKSVKSYSFIQLLNNYGNANYYVIIPKEKAVFETYPIVYHDENGKEASNPEYGLGVKVKN